MSTYDSDQFDTLSARLDPTLMHLYADQAVKSSVYHLKIGFHEEAKIEALQSIAHSLLAIATDLHRKES